MMNYDNVGFGKIPIRACDFIFLNITALAFPRRMPPYVDAI